MSMNWLDKIKWDDKGLVPVIAQEKDTGDVLMFAWMNREALQETAESGRAVYFSRSRSRLWRKGEESGHVQVVHDIRLDCDNDVILLKVQNVGGAACHNGYKSCFYRKLADDVNPADPASFKLQFTSQPLFDPATVYKKK